MLVEGMDIAKVAVQGVACLQRRAPASFVHKRHSLDTRIGQMSHIQPVASTLEGFPDVNLDQQSPDSVSSTILLKRWVISCTKLGKLG